MQTESLENFPFPINNILEYRPLVSDIIPSERCEPTHYHYQQVMMAFEQPDQTHQLEIEMLDPTSSPTTNPHLHSNRQSTSCSVTPPQSCSSDLLLTTTTEQSKPDCLSDSHLPSDPLSLLLTVDSAHQPSSHSSSEYQSQSLPELSLQPPSPTYVESLNSDNLQPSLPSQAVCQQSAEALSIVPPVAPSPQATTDAFASSPTIVSSQPPQSQKAILDGHQHTSNPDHASTFPVDSEDKADLELVQHVEEEDDCLVQWDHNPLVDEPPYQDYELESRPKVRTELLEHVRVEFETVSLNDQDLPIESNLVPVPGVRLICEGCEYSLFQAIQPYSDSDSTTITQTSSDETVLLSEPEYRELYYAPLESFIQSLHNIFPNLHDNNKNELVLNFPTLEIKVPEDNIYSKEISLFDVDRLHIGARLPDRLSISLEKQPRLVHRFNVLATYVSELVEDNASLDGDLGEVFAEDEVEPLMQHSSNDADPTDISDESKIEGLHTRLVSNASIAVGKLDDKLDVSTTTTEDSFPVAVTLLKDEATQPIGTFVSSDLPHVDGLSSSCAPIHAAAVDLDTEVSETTTDHLAVIDESSVIQPTEPLELPEDTDLYADELSHTLDEKSLETPVEVVDENLNSVEAFESSQKVVAQLEGILPSQKDNVLDEAGSCFNSALTITALDQLSEGEIQEFDEDEAEAPLSVYSTPAHDAINHLSHDVPAIWVPIADNDPNSDALLPPISQFDYLAKNSFSNDSSPTHVVSKRNHAEVDESLESDRPTNGNLETLLQNSDVKKARVL